MNVFPAAASISAMAACMPSSASSSPRPGPSAPPPAPAAEPAAPARPSSLRASAPTGSAAFSPPAAAPRGSSVSSGELSVGSRSPSRRQLGGDSGVHLRIDVQGRGPFPQIGQLMLRPLPLRLPAVHVLLELCPFFPGFGDGPLRGLHFFPQPLVRGPSASCRSALRSSNSRSPSARRVFCSSCSWMKTAALLGQRKALFFHVQPLPGQPLQHRVQRFRSPSRWDCSCCSAANRAWAPCKSGSALGKNAGTSSDLLRLRGALGRQLLSRGPPAPPGSPPIPRGGPSACPPPRRCGPVPLQTSPPGRGAAPPSPQLRMRRCHIVFSACTFCRR